MSESAPSAAAADLQLPRPQRWQEKSFIAAPDLEVFTSHFGDTLPKPEFLQSELGLTAVYNLEPRLTQKRRPILMIHGINTPALGLLPLARALQALDPDAHIVLFDLWGHGMSSTPLVAHTPQTFHAQIYQVLGYMGWSKAHIMGYSFGGTTLVSFANSTPWMCLSVTLLGSAGLLKYDEFSPHIRDMLEDSGKRENEAIDTIMEWLEGGPLVLPEGWKEKMTDAQVAAAALRAFSRDRHQGYPHSVLNMFRFGGVWGCGEKFKQLAASSTKSLCVVGEEDPFCKKDQLLALGFEDVKMVGREGHDFVRTMPTQTARFVHEFLLTVRSING